jgi:hypothetical protein
MPVRRTAVALLTVLAVSTPLLAACGRGEVPAGAVRAVAVPTPASADAGDSGPAGRRVALRDTAPGWTLVSARNVEAGSSLPRGTEVVVRAYVREGVRAPDGAVVATVAVPAAMSSSLTDMLAAYRGDMMRVAGRSFTKLDGTETCTLVGRADQRTLLVASRASCADLASLVAYLVGDD